MPQVQAPGAAQRFYQVFASLLIITVTLGLPWYVSTHDPYNMWQPYAVLALLTLVVFTLYHQLFAKKFNH